MGRAEDEFFMQEALVQASIAYALDEVPVGAVLVHEGIIVARAHNLVETQNDATCHAELLCLREASHFLENWRLLGTTLYSTLEPCAMCAGALLLSRVSRLVYGAADLRHGAHKSWCNLFDHSHPTHSLEVDSGVLGETSAYLLRTFFQNQREKKDEHKSRAFQTNGLSCDGDDHESKREAVGFSKTN